MFIKDLIKKLREEKGFTQRQLAYLSGVNNTEVSRIEKGERKNPNPKTLQKLAKPLGVDYHLLYEAAGYIKEYESKEVELDHVLKESNVTYKGEPINDKKRQEIRKALEEMPSAAHSEGEFETTEELIDLLSGALERAREWHAKKKGDVK